MRLGISPGDGKMSDPPPWDRAGRMDIQIVANDFSACLVSIGD
jgi:hypothetical protein